MYSEFRTTNNNKLCELNLDTDY